MSFVQNTIPAGNTVDQSNITLHVILCRILFQLATLLIKAILPCMSFVQNTIPAGNTVDQSNITLHVILCRILFQLLPGVEKVLRPNLTLTDVIIYN
jgi:hypothetical protein